MPRACSRSNHWKAGLGLPAIGSKRYGAGLLSTASRPLFAGDDQGEFTALDARSGESLWHFNTGQQITASPVAYSWRGEDYIAITTVPTS